MQQPESQNYFSGTSGLLLPVPNKLFYPPEFQGKSRLSFYSSLMNSIEINSSFYKVPRAATVARWTQEVSPGFKFTFKLSRDITHQKNLEFEPKNIQAFMDVIQQAGPHKGCLLVQFPASIGFQLFNKLSLLVRVLHNTQEAQEWNIAFEFRHKSLYRDEVYELLAQHNYGLVIQDMPAAATPFLEQNCAFVYLRFHGPDGSYRGTYEKEILSEYASYIKDWQMEGKTVYSYFNNTMGSAVENVVTLRQLI